MKITGIANWCYINILDTKFDPCWRVELHVTKEESEKLKAIGVKPNILDTDSEYKYSVSFKRKELRKDGSKNKQPRLVDNNLETITDNVGNGSLINVQFSVYNWEFKGKKGIGLELQAIQVLKLVPYAGSGVNEFEVVKTEESLEGSAASNDLEF